MIPPLSCLHVIFKRKAETARAVQAAKPAHAAQVTEAAHKVQAAETSPLAPVTMLHKVKSIRLLVSAPGPQPEKESSEDLPMVVDEEPEVSAASSNFLLIISDI
jgi:hypothetical protein